MACGRGWLYTVAASHADRGTNQHDSSPALVRALVGAQDRPSSPPGTQNHLLGTDDAKLVTRLPAAKAAIDARLHDLQLNDGGTLEERQAISDALAGLNVLRRDLQARSQETGSSEA